LASRAKAHAPPRKRDEQYLTNLKHVEQQLVNHDFNRLFWQEIFPKQLS